MAHSPDYEGQKTAREVGEIERLCNQIDKELAELQAQIGETFTVFKPVLDEGKETRPMSGEVAQSPATPLGNTLLGFVERVSMAQQSLIELMQRSRL